MTPDYFTPVALEAEPFAMSQPPVRVAVMNMARQAITVDRAATHGKAEDSFGLIAAYWSAHLDRPITATDVGTMLALFKLARAKGNPGHLDNWTDAIGYSALTAEIAGAK
jgi:hypothetical protein